MAHWRHFKRWAHYFAGIPGRKNPFWIIGNFPHSEPINACSETIDVLGEAGISVYPIDAWGVDVNMGIGPDPDFHQAARRFIDSESWAEYTGGKAYHVNDIDREIAMLSIMDRATTRWPVFRGITTKRGTGAHSRSEGLR